MAKAKQESDGVLFLGAGDDLTGPQVMPQQKVPRARLILDAYKLLGIEAMALGEKDTEAGVPVPVKLQQGAVVSRGGVKFGVFSFDLSSKPEAKPETKINELKARANELRKRGARVVVALLHGGMQAVKGLLEPGGAGIDFAIVSHSPWGTTRVERAGSTWLVETPPQGKMVGRLDLHVLDGKLGFVDIGGRGEGLQRIHEAEQELAGLAKRYGDATGAMREYYVKRKGELESQVAARKAILAQESGGKPVRVSWMENQLVTLGTDIQDLPAIAGMIKKYKDEVGAVGNVPGTAATGTAVAPTTAAIATATAAGYVGIHTCRACHEAAYGFWRRTKHSHAWESLIPNNQLRDPACVVCHVTGGVAISLPDVQCEACHGPGAAHVANTAGKGIVIRNPPEATCTKCHHAPQSKEWDFVTFRKAILGPGHGQPPPKGEPTIK